MNQKRNVIKFPDQSDDESFEDFWEICQGTQVQISYERARRLYHATPEQFFSRAGWVYVLGGEYLADDVYKIGMTTGRIERRMRQLYTTGVPGEFNCIHAGWFADCRHAEAFIHEQLDAYRISFDREFFYVDLNTINDAFLTCEAVGDACPSHMVEQLRRRERYAFRTERIRGATVAAPSFLEVPF